VTRNKAEGHTEQVEFLAAIPPLGSAIKVHGEAGGRITLDVDDSQLPDLLRLVAWRDQLLRVVVQPAGLRSSAQRNAPDEL
jgi:hypothetical protein